MSGALPPPPFRRPERQNESSEFKLSPSHVSTAQRHEPNGMHYMQHEAHGEASEQTSLIRDLRPRQQPVAYATPSQSFPRDHVYVHDRQSLPQSGLSASGSRRRPDTNTRMPQLSSAPRLEFRAPSSVNYPPVKQQPPRPYTPSPKRVDALGRSDSSVASPFFQTGGGAQQPHVRGKTFIRPGNPYGMDLHHIQQGFRMRPAQRPPLHSSCSRYAPNEQTFMPHPYHISDRESIYEHPAFIPQYVQSYSLPQTPRDSQGYLTRPDRQDTKPPLPARFSVSSSQQLRYVGPLRSTQPSLVQPIRAVPQSRSHPDQALKNFRGVKGATAYSTTYNTGEGAHVSQRPVFSRAGMARRSVVR